MILASAQGRPALLHGATAGFWQAQARVVQAGTCRGPAVPEACEDITPSLLKLEMDPQDLLEWFFLLP